MGAAALHRVVRPVVGAPDGVRVVIRLPLVRRRRLGLGQLRPQLVHPRRGLHRHLSSATAGTCTPKGSVARLPKRNAAQPERGQEEWPNGVAGFFQALSAPGCRCEGPGTSFFCPHGAGAGALRASSSSRSSQQAWWRGPALTLRRASLCATAVGSTSARASAIAAIRHIITVLTAGMLK